MRVWLVAVLAGLIGFGLARWTGEPTRDPAADRATVGDTSRREPKEDAPPSVRRRAESAPVGASPVIRLANPPEVPAPDGPRLALDPVAFLSQWPLRLDDLAKRAKGGDARALTELAEALDYCNAAIGVAVWARSAPRGRMGDLADTTVQAYFAEVGGLCKALKQRHPWLADLDREVMERIRDYYKALADKQVVPGESRPPANTGEELRRRAAQAGDTVASGLTNNDEVLRRCGGTPAGQNQPNPSLADPVCVHEAARERLAAIFARRDPQAIEAMPRILASMGALRGLGTEFVLGFAYGAEENNVRWTLAACALGLDCGPTGRALRWACATGRACGYRHFRDYAADRLLPPAAMRMVDGQVPRLVNLILAGDVDSVLGPPPSTRQR
jgi:hypothetical protein